MSAAVSPRGTDRRRGPARRVRSRHAVVWPPRRASPPLACVRSSSQRRRWSATHSPSSSGSSGRSTSSARTAPSRSAVELSPAASACSARSSSGRASSTSTTTSSARTSDTWPSHESSVAPSMPAVCRPRRTRVSVLRRPANHVDGRSPAHRTVASCSVSTTAPRCSTRKARAARAPCRQARPRRPIRAVRPGETARSAQSARSSFPGSSGRRV